MLAPTDADEAGEEEEDRSTLVAPGPGLTNVSGMVVGCLAATLVIVVMVSRIFLDQLEQPLSPKCHKQNVNIHSSAK